LNNDENKEPIESKPLTEYEQKFVQVQGEQGAEHGDKGKESGKLGGRPKPVFNDSETPLDNQLSNPIKNNIIYYCNSAGLDCRLSQYKKPPQFIPLIE
jgi:hypothetical protein